MTTARMGTGFLVRVGISLGVLAGILMSVFVFAPEGQAAFPGVNGKIVFTRELDATVPGNATTDVYVMNADGTGQVNLTNSPGEDSKPAWSPDGSKIAYIHNDDIYSMNADGTSRVNLTYSPVADQAPAWSPDSSKIAFTRHGVGIPSGIYVMNADGTGQVRLTDTSTYSMHPAWSPDGSKIAFIGSINNSGGLCVMNADGSNVTLLTNSGSSYPNWSPDGSKIAFGSYVSDKASEILVINADGSGLTNLTNHPAFELYPSWSPDGSRITFTSNRDGEAEIYTMNVDGSAIKQLTKNSLPDSESDWQSLPDTTAPAVSNVQPRGVVTSGSATISADYADDYSSIDTASVVVTLDGQPLSGCTVGANHVSCPANNLAPGSHAIGGKVGDKAGNHAGISGSFTVVPATAPQSGIIGNLLDWILGLLFGSGGRGLLG